MPLARHTTLGVGGPARWFLQARTTDEACAALEEADAKGVAVLVLGGGSNLLIADAGFDGLVVRLPDQAGTVGDDGAWHLPAGASWDAVVARAVARGHAGIECLAGIPGTVGAAPIQNVGAYGQEVAEVIEAVEVWDRHAGTRRWIAGADCGFGYRHSRFKGVDAGRFVVLSVRMRLRPGGAATVRYRDLQQRLGSNPTLAQTRETVLTVRRSKSMVLDPADPNTRSAGSFFVNPIVHAAQFEALDALHDGPVPHWTVPGGVKLAAAWLIENAGMPKGFGDGPVGLSTRHTLAIVNRGGATAAQVRAFALQVQRTVMDRFGVELVPEPRFVGF